MPARYDLHPPFGDKRHDLLQICLEIGHYWGPMVKNCRIGSSSHGITRRGSTGMLCTGILIFLFDGITL